MNCKVAALFLGSICKMSRAYQKLLAFGSISVLLCAWDAFTVEWIPNQVLSRIMYFDFGLGEDVLSSDRCNPVAKVYQLSGNAKCDFVFVRKLGRMGAAAGAAAGGMAAKALFLNLEHSVFCRF